MHIYIFGIKLYYSITNILRGFFTVLKKDLKVKLKNELKIY